MFRKYMIFILAAFMIVGTNACTSKKASDESADVEQGLNDDGLEAADSSGANSDSLSADDSGAVADLGGTNDDLAPEEKMPDEKAAPGGADALAQNDTVTPPADQGGDIPPPPQADQAAAGSTEPAPPPEPGMENKDAGAAPPVAEAAPPDAAPPVAEPMAPPAAASEPKPAATLQKMKTTPWKQGKILANALYIARKGDTVESISQKVFGSKDKVKQLCQVNKANCTRPAKVGDKFYYNSPQRPDDETTVKTFYEDAGIAPQMYEAKEGDNIRKVGKQLLGDINSWKELWATNDVESKQGLDAGTKLKYWPDTEAAPAQTMAKTEDGGAPPADQAQATPPDGAAPADQAQATPPTEQAAQPPPPPPPQDNLPPAPQDQAMNQTPPPAAAATAAPPEPPAPPPPPPPAEQATHSAPAAVDGAGQDPNQMMALGVGAVLLLAAAALFISIRKKRARRQIDFNTTTQTQIE